MFPLTAVLGGLQTLGGIFGVTAGKRPTWNIPGSAYEQVNNARSMSSANVRPGNQQAVDQINKTAANQASQITRNAGSGAQALSALGGVEQIQQNSVANNNAANAQFQYNAKQQLQNTLGNFAQYQREAFIKNTWEPYQERAATKSALISSGLQNIFGGINAMQSQKMQQNFLASIYGNRGTYDAQGE